MKNSNCLSEQNLILHYYGDLPENKSQTRHLTNCPQCQNRLATLSNDLAKLPNLDYEPDYAIDIRMAARVSEQLNGRQRNWIPVLGASIATTVALVITISIWSPQDDLGQTSEFKTPPLAAIDLNADLPDIDFLDELELLQELELLSQIEGV